MCWHKWTKWEQYTESGVVTSMLFRKIDKPLEYSEKRQKRHCEKCGKQQDELVMGS
jgi:hypothetical protein